jgi:hypothetical protein
VRVVVGGRRGGRVRWRQASLIEVVDGGVDDKPVTGARSSVHLL